MCVSDAFLPGSPEVRKDKSRGFRWHAVAKLFLEQIPLLMVFSGMKLLSAVTPQVLIPALTEKVQFALRQPSCKGVPSLAVFLVSRVVYFIIGFDVFLVKFHATVYGEKARIVHVGLARWLQTSLFSLAVLKACCRSWC